MSKSFIVSFEPQKLTFDAIFTPENLVFDIAFSTQIGLDLPIYAGPYEVTPTRATQTLVTQGLALENNITINPIPPQYGLVSWDGFGLTVS